eukprot:TRINITY_DN12412_c0_g1_i1.p1 TRINITY_DN12412_c0_g1~~TRINITY_DN12412_c0_g1_i1.p1  ORF type:complete len:107 (+),score=16.50 TRINITY_DN12412_c0_g1_i1:64-384(+)
MCIRDSLQAMSLGSGLLGKIASSSFTKLHLSAFAGFFLGVKTCDLIFFDDKKYMVLRENMEDEFWAKYGEPTELQPYVVDSTKNEAEKRKSWIHIMYEKDKRIKKQ